MEIPGIARRWWDKIIQAVNRLLRSGTEAAAATGEAAASGDAPAEEGELAKAATAETAENSRGGQSGLRKLLPRRRRPQSRSRGHARRQ